MIRSTPNQYFFLVLADGAVSYWLNQWRLRHISPCLSNNDSVKIMGRSPDASSSIKFSATGRLLEITYMCYEYRTLLFPAQLLHARQSDMSVTSIPQSVNRRRHNEHSWCSHPLHFVQASNTPVVKVRLVVWRSDLTGQGDPMVLRSWSNIVNHGLILPPNRVNVSFL